MNDTPLAEAALDAAATGFAEVADGFADELGGRPTLAEFLEIIGWAVPSISDSADDSLAPPMNFKATLKGNKKYTPAGQSRTAELNDGVFVDATDQLVELLDGLHETAGEPVSAQTLAAALRQVIQTGQIAFADISGEQVGKLAADAPKKRYPKPKPGDVLAIPARDGGFHLAVMLTRDSFGTALGLFEGISPVPRLGAELRAAPRPRPVYTDDQQVIDGVWRVVEHDEGLSSRFAQAEIYHKPGAWPGIDTGEHGAAETAGGELRMIGPDEAQEVGLVDGSYRQGYLGADLQRLLDERSSQ